MKNREIGGARGTYRGGRKETLTTFFLGGGPESKKTNLRS